jgi:hypothetical protein
MWSIPPPLQLVFPGQSLVATIKRDRKIDIWRKEQTDKKRCTLDSKKLLKLSAVDVFL